MKSQRYPRAAFRWLAALCFFLIAFISGARAQVYEKVFSFTDSNAINKGSQPSAALVKGIDDNFYGTTRLGGANNLGTVFILTPSGVMTTLVSFTGTAGSNKGSEPQAALVQDGNGNLYGTTSGGGVKWLGHDL